MAFELPKLHFELNALEPVISGKTMDFHYNKHHKAYVDKLNELIRGTPYENMSLEQVIRESAEHSHEVKIFNNASQAWNHAFFWNCLSPKRQQPSAHFKELLADSFEGFDNFKTKFAEAANERFGSGWAWLVERPDHKLQILSTSNAEDPLLVGAKPLLTLDVWEHAYYLDYQNRRPDFTKAVIDTLLNWDFAETQYAAAQRIPSRQMSAVEASTLRH